MQNWSKRRPDRVSTIRRSFRMITEGTKVTTFLSRHWLLVGWLTAFVVGTDLFIVAPFLPSIGSELGRDPASLTLLVGAFSLAYAVACPLQGRLAERVGLSRVLCFGVFALGAANLYTAAASDLLQLTLSRCLAGCAAASVTPMLYALAAERAAPASRSTSLALVNSGLILALAGGAPLGLIFGEFAGWRVVFALLGGMLFVLGPVHLAMWQRQRATPATAPVLVRPERLRDATIFLGCMMLWAIPIYASYTLLGTALDGEMHWPVPRISAMLACFGAGATLGAVLGGRMADRIGPASFVRLSFVLTGAAFLVASWIYRQHNEWALGCALFLISFVAYGFFPALQACAAAVFRVRRPTVLGLMSSSLYVGTALGASLGATLFWRGGLILVLLTSAAVAFAGWAAAMRLPRPQPMEAAVQPAE
jgi:predicted MFS family arabinose efflux permease